LTWQKWYDIFLEEEKKQLETAPEVSPVHRTDHILRVWNKSKELCKKLGGDMDVMVATVLLHDLGRHLGLEIHGRESAELAKPILEKHGFPADKMKKTLEAISQHDYTFPPEKRTLLEAKILYDADKMDAFGVVGVYRHILFIEAGRIKMEDVLPLLKKRFEGLALDESRAVAKADYEYIVAFFKILGEELDKGG
jgi:HD superfamily phosphodiesterase